jgi:chromate reductase
MSELNSTVTTLIGISGSLRQNSSSTLVLRAIADHLPPDIDMTIAPLHQIPLYDEDDKRAATLSAVSDLCRAVYVADGMVVISPEYNHSITGVLKNAIDWVSRPGYASVLRNKPVLVISTSNSQLGGARAQLHLRELFASTLSRVVARRQVVIGEVAAKVTDGRFAHAPTLEFLSDSIGDLVDEVSLMRHRSNQKGRGSLLSWEPKLDQDLVG